VRHWIGIVLVIGLAAVAPQTVMTIGASAVSVLLESLPYLAIATALTPLAARYAHALVAFAGCGCGRGPSARSIPAAIATAAIFGAPVALTRVVLASLVARIRPSGDCGHGDVLGELQHLVPAALLSALVMLNVPALPLRGVHPAIVLLCGALLGVAASPCALGGVALAAALHANAPFAAMGVLCTAGIVPNVVRRQVHAARHDPLAYLLLAAACGTIALHHGGTLVHPRMTIPLAVCGIYCAILAWQHRALASRAARLIAAATFAVVIIGAPAPDYRATETTLADAFAGEHVDFTGVAVHERAVSALVRYAITCCRADAAPVALALDRNIAGYDGHWMRARGVIENDAGTLRLHVADITPVAPPSDPFVYR
jgi:hypothetical protein